MSGQNGVPPDATKGNSWIEKAQVAKEFINTVGVPVLIVLVMLLWLVGTVTGYFPYPWVTAAEFKTHADTSAKIIEILGEQTKTINEQAKIQRSSNRVIQLMRCDRKPTKDEQLKCREELDEE